MLIKTVPTTKVQLSIHRQFIEYSARSNILTDPIVPIFSSPLNSCKQVRLMLYNYINITRNTEIYADSCYV